MTDHRSTLKATSSSSWSSLLSSHSLSLLLLTALSFSLAAFAFLLQWRGGLPDSISRFTPEFPGATRSRPVRSSSRSSDCQDILGQNRSPSFQHSKNWKFTLGPKPGSDQKTKVCITTTTSAGLEQILPWIFFHKVVGVTNFFLFVEGKAASVNVSMVLESIPGVKVIYRTRESEEQQARSRAWNETWLEKFFYKPCNHELFVRQSLNMEMAIDMARDASMDWIIHLDTDELLHPAGTSEYSVQQLLSEMPEKVDTIVFLNYESCVERDDIKEPFSEVSMFKKNRHHLTEEIYNASYNDVARGNPRYFLTYRHGKSAARIQDHLRSDGAHRWHNYMKDPYEIFSNETAILHYTYSRFSDLTSRRNRCSCKPTKKDVQRCFILQFDRNAFIIASTATEEEMLQWYREHVVWTDKEVINKLLKMGVFMRIYSPMIIMQGLRESGVFTSVISSALKNVPDDKFSPSSESNNLSKEISSQKVERQESQGTTRRMALESARNSYAVPPQSPPSIKT